MTAKFLRWNLTMDPSLTREEHAFHMNFIRPQDVQVMQLDDCHAKVRCLLCAVPDIPEHEVGFHFESCTHTNNFMVLLEGVHGGHPTTDLLKNPLPLAQKAAYLSGDLYSVPYDVMSHHLPEGIEVGDYEDVSGSSKKVLKCVACSTESTPSLVVDTWALCPHGHD